jgi:DNA-binding PucR family transcriptional regulator
MRGEMLLAVLDGRGSAEETATRLGFVPSQPLSVLAFELAGGDSAVDDLQRERLVDLVMVHCEASCRQTAVVAIGRTVYALLQDERELVSARILEIVRRIQAHAESRLGAALLAAIGSTADGARDVARARRDAERVLGVLRVDRKERTVAEIDDVRGEVVLLELRELAAGHPSLMKGRLELVLDHDAEHRTAYGETLRAYLDAFGDVGAAAARVSVHPNTFRYRMRRLVELFEVDLANPEERLVLELQFRLLTQDDAATRRPNEPSRRSS